MPRDNVAPAAVLLLSAAAAPSQPAWLDVPFVRQQREGCGSAAVAMVARYWMKQGFTLPAEVGDAREIHRKLYSPQERGTPAAVLVLYLATNGFDAYPFVGEWKDLEWHLSNGRPLIVSLSNGPKKPRHFAVLVGLRDDKALLHDPANGKLRQMRRADFEKRWAAAGRWTLLAVPRREP
jgi:ABC-type bacteriocin/lantibiotic exporter with double-glycine peptidase domain